MVSRLTDRQILAVKPTKGERVDTFDAQVPGLLIRSSGEGRRTWYLRYRLPDGRQPRLKLGTYPATSISDARDKAHGALKHLEAGSDPAELERSAAAAARAQKIRTFDDLSAAYFEACRAGVWIPKGKPKKLATIEDEEGIYSRHVKKELGRRALGEIRRGDIKALGQAIVQRGLTAKANHAHALVRQIFSYAVEEELVEVNPAMGLAAPAPKRARERMLSDAELKAFWRAAKEPRSATEEGDPPLLIGKPVGIALRLCALLLQRRAEVATLRLADVDLGQGVWLIPGDRAKNGRPHIVPLPPMAVGLIREAIEARGKSPSPFLFPAPRGGGASPIHPDALTRAMGHMSKALKVPLMGPHDLRRTGATVMASERLGVAPFIISQVLNHTTDAGGGSATTRTHYNRHAYDAEKRAALERWQDMLTSIVETAVE